jgi:hypothetical protein
MWSRIVNLFRPDGLSCEIDEDLQSHLAEAVEQAATGVKLAARWAQRCACAKRAGTCGTIWLDSLRAYIAVFSAMLLVTMLAVRPELAQERLHPGAGGQDAKRRFAIGLLFLVTVGFAALDVGRLHESDGVPAPLSIISLILFTPALGL